MAAPPKRCANCGKTLDAKAVKGAAGMAYCSDKCKKAHEKRKVCEFC